MDDYRTISTEAKGVFKDRKSSFYGFVFPVASQTQIKDILKNIRKEYHDAVHHCYAYRLLSDNQQIMEFYTDDGEPANTAGIPILNELRKHDLCNVLAVVVRYYGGIKLGVPGLIHAYREAIRLALQEASIVQREVTVPLQLEFAFDKLNTVMNLIKRNSVQIVQQDFSDRCSIHLLCPKKNIELFTNELKQHNILVYA